MDNKMQSKIFFFVKLPFFPHSNTRCSNESLSKPEA